MTSPLRLFALPGVRCHHLCWIAIAVPNASRDPEFRAGLFFTSLRPMRSPLDGNSVTNLRL